jgi:membrane protein YdbS with pleckstrin-like domain
MTPFSVWLVAILSLWLIWFAFGPSNRWWTTAMGAAVIAVATFITLNIWPPTERIKQQQKEPKAREAE